MALKSEDLARDIAAVSLTDTAGDATRIFCEACIKAGFPSMFLGDIPYGDEKLENQMLHVMPDDPWPLHYSNMDFRIVDPVIPIARTLRYDVVTWRMARATVRTNSMASRMFEDAKKFDLYDGFAVLRATPNQTLGYASMHGPKDCDTALTGLERYQFIDLAKETILSECRFSEVAQAIPDIPRFSPREREVLRYVVDMRSNQYIASKLGISEKTLESHLTSLYRLCAVPDGPDFNKRVGLARIGKDMGFEPIEPVLTKDAEWRENRGLPQLPV